MEVVVDILHWSTLEFVSAAELAIGGCKNIFPDL
jgi:hypothetical protein